MKAGGTDAECTKKSALGDPSDPDYETRLKCPPWMTWCGVGGVVGHYGRHYGRLGGVVPKDGKF